MPITGDEQGLLSSSRQPGAEVDRTAGGVGRVPHLLPIAVAILAMSASLAGLLIDGINTAETSAAEMFRGFDLVTAVVVAPSLVVAARLAQRGSVQAQLITTSLVAYIIYTYAYYLFGTGFNDLFLLHAATFATALLALVLTLAALDVSAVAERFGPRTHVRGIAAILGTLGIALGGMWIFFAIDNAVTGDIPAGSQLVETDSVVHLGMALDLTLLVPLYLAAATLLWRRAPWGFVLAAIALIAGVLHQVSYLVALPLQVTADVEGAVYYDPVEPIIVLMYLVATSLLIRGVDRPTSSGRAP